MALLEPVTVPDARMTRRKEHREEALDKLLYPDAKLVEHIGGGTVSDDQLHEVSLGELDGSSSASVGGQLNPALAHLEGRLCEVGLQGQAH